VLVLDLSGVTFMDGTGLSTLTRARERALAVRRRLILVEMPTAAKRALVVTRLAQLFEWAVHPGLIDFD
jgi:anti-anti-sigma factor